MRWNGVLRIQSINDTRQCQHGELMWKLMTVQGEVISSGKNACVIPANSSVQLADVNACGVEPDQTILYAAFFQQGVCVSETRYFLAPFKKMLCPNAQPMYRVEKEKDGLLRLHLYSDCFVWMLHIAEEEGVELSDNDFDLIPGEEKIVCVSTDANTFVPQLYWGGRQADVT